MSLCKSPTLTPALLAANRRNAQKFTGPRAAQAKTESRMNGLGKGTRSPFYRDLLQAMFFAPPCRVEQTARVFLSPEAASHPLMARTLELSGRAEAEVVLDFKRRGRSWPHGKNRYKSMTFGAGMLLKTKKPWIKKSAYPDKLLKNRQLDEY